MNLQHCRVHLAIAAALAACGAAAAGEQPEASASRIVQQSGVRGGLVVRLGCRDPKRVAALRVSERYVVHGLDTDPRRVAAAREVIRSLGLYGPVSVERFDGRRLPYVDNLVDLLVADRLGEVSREEVLRVLAPGGVAVIGAEQLVKPWPPGMDQWTHWLHGPDGNAVAADRIVGPPRRAQWMSEPLWQRHHELSPSVSAMVTAAGRLLLILNEAPPGIDGLPDRWALVARDAWNGKLLWRRPIAEWGWRWWSDHSYGDGRWNHPTHIARRLAAVQDRVYVTLGFNAPVSALDAATGETVRTYAGTERADEILYCDGVLIVAVNDEPAGPGRIKDKPPPKKSVVALNADTGQVLWRAGGLEGAASKADAIERITHLLLVAGGGGVYCVEENAVTALDFKTGKRLWRYDRGTRPRTVTYGSYYITNLNTIVYHGGVVLLMEPDPTVKRMPYNAPTRCTVIALAAGTGEVLWRRRCGFWGHYGQGDLFFIDGLAWAHEADGFSMVGLDPRTGEVKRRVSTREALDQGHHHRCYRNKATARYVITGRRGAEFIDLASGENWRHHWVRGTCRYGVMPANGLLYAPPHPCVCYITAKLNGLWALAPGSRSADDEAAVEVEDVWERGPAFGFGGERAARAGAAAAPGDAAAVRPGQWPTHRGDRIRSGHCPTTIPGNVSVAWRTELAAPLSAPTIAEGKVFVAAVDEQTVYALDQDSGSVAWSYTAGGRVDTPPTVHRGLALFGSADGWAYCLRAKDGLLVWRRRIAPQQRRMMCRERLESPWPLHGSVLVQDGVAYVAAGRSSFLDGGIRVAALDPATGRMLREARVNSYDPATGDMPPAMLYYDMPPDQPGALSDILVGGDGEFYLRHLKFDPETLAYGTASTLSAEARRAAARESAAVGQAGLNQPAPERRPRVQAPVTVNHLMSTAGLLDGSWFNQTYWTIDGAAHSKLLVFDDKAAYGVKPYTGAARHSRAIFRPGAKGYTLFCEERPGHARRWSVQVPVRIRAMVLAGAVLFAAGPPDVADAADPWAAIEGRRGGRLLAVSAREGETLAELPLDAPPVFDGMAAAGEDLVVSGEDGAVACLRPSGP